MKKLSLIVVLFILLQFKGLAQDAINHYKYIIVPTSYSFLDGEDKYQLNSLTKFLFNKYGYTAFFANEELPQDLNQNRCMALYTDVVQDKGLFKTKLRIDLKDCGGNVVMSSKVGETREKQFDKAYNMALRDAFETYQNFDYKYEPSKSDKSTMTETKMEVKPIVEEKMEVSKSVETPKAVMEQPKTEVKEVAAAVAVTPETIVEEPKLEVKQTKVEFEEETKDILYAQPVKNGFQVVDMTPKIVMILLETAKSNVYLVKGEDAIVYQEEGSWFISKNDGAKVSVKALNIKF